jgi:hypothetical protein
MYRYIAFDAEMMRMERGDTLKDSVKRRKWALDARRYIYAVELERVVKTFYSNEWSKSPKKGNYVKYIPLGPSKPKHLMMPSIPDYVYRTGESNPDVTLLT